jgi:hypothetical protein
MIINMGPRLQLLLLCFFSLAYFISAQESNPLAVLVKFPECAVSPTLSPGAHDIPLTRISKHASSNNSLHRSVAQQIWIASVPTVNSNQVLRTV